MNALTQTPAASALAQEQQASKPVEYKFHPEAARFPLLDEKSPEFLGLVADIKANGLREPIELLNSMIIDGRNRDRACKQAEIKPEYKRLPSDTNPVAHVLSKNVHRRHLKESQRAIIGAQAVTTTHGGDRKNQDASLPLEITQEYAAQLAGICKRLMTDAVKILSNPDLVKKVWEGTMTVSAARKEFDKQANAKDEGGEAEEGGEETEEEESQEKKTTKASDYVDEVEEELIEALKEYEAVSDKATVQDAVADIVRRFQDAGWLERTKKKAA
jgi:hypothetical protein